MMPVKYSKNTESTKADNARRLFPHSLWSFFSRAVASWSTITSSSSSGKGPPGRWWPCSGSLLSPDSLVLPFISVAIAVDSANKAWRRLSHRGQHHWWKHGCFLLHLGNFIRILLRAMTIMSKLHDRLEAGIHICQQDLHGFPPLGMPEPTNTGPVDTSWFSQLNAKEFNVDF